MRTMHIMRAKVHIFFDIRKLFTSNVTIFNILWPHSPIVYSCYWTGKQLQNKKAPDLFHSGNEPDAGI